MELRTRLADKEIILAMMSEFEQTQSAHDAGFWDAENFVYEEAVSKPCKKKWE